MTETEWTPELMLSYATEFSFNGWKIRQRHVLANPGCWTAEDDDGRFLLTRDAEWARRANLYPSVREHRDKVSFEHLVDVFKAVAKAGD
ncbi:hypothetical protein GCM10010149_88610 [Nonomuraea roseoviolacea subsp. roseoviolacea]|uniref:hypothetical protein n=1 Tax=Nonomuraea roseoviolacea TaxID=103837 RepID=UPI0031DBF1CD